MVISDIKEYRTKQTISKRWLSEQATIIVKVFLLFLNYFKYFSAFLNRFEILLYGSISKRFENTFSFILIYCNNVGIESRFVLLKSNDA